MRVVRAVWVPLSLAALLTLAVIIVAATGDGILARTATDALIRMVLVIGLYIFIGNSGVLAFGHIGFTLIGAYATAWFTLPPLKKAIQLQLPAVLAERQFPAVPSAIAAGLLAAIVAVVVGVPIMRLGGIAASIATLSVLGMLYTFYTNWPAWTMGAATLPGIPIYVDMWVALAWVVVALFAAYAFQVSRLGLALRAAREDEFAARASGIGIWTQRLVAFGLSAFFMGIGGVLQAHFLGSIAVKNFWLSLTFVSIAMLIVGGQRSLTGAVVGAAVVSLIVEVLRQLESGVDLGFAVLQVPLGARELGIAIVMLLILILRPAGLTGGREIPWPWRRAAQPEAVRA
ncbi:MAG: branched-chain amino acid ABC transporter permease [Alphaproteobacteria bacterium]|nr:branched-chain amino acid ABC transporter permease [Alphaproteobacteria bacterium]